MGSKCDFPSELGLSVLFVVVNTVINIELYGIHLVKVKPIGDLSIFFLLDHMYHVLARWEPKHRKRVPETLLIAIILHILTVAIAS